MLVNGRYMIVIRNHHWYSCAMSNHRFKTEVAQLLDLIIHSLYSHREIFLRELISNASDALDKLKYLNQTDDAYRELSVEPRIDIRFDEQEHRTLSIIDNGIGMNEDDLNEQLGTIARSGTKNFLAQIKAQPGPGSNLIGQFGVGFYSSFMVTERVEVTSRRANEEQSWRWVSNGRNQYSIEPAGQAAHGTTVTLFLNEEGREFAHRGQIEELVKEYSNHIAFPIYLHYSQKEYDNSGREMGTTSQEEQINSASALWKRPKSALTSEDYQNFYKTIGHDSEEPLFYIHTQAEGTLEYSSLFFVPRTAPADMFYADYQPGIKLYIRRVFITNDRKDLMPSYLRFLRGVIDSEDLPLNISREILQQNKVLQSIRAASVKRVLNELSRLSHEDSATYDAFIVQYNRLLKEGLYQDSDNREILLELLRFKSSTEEGYISLSDYCARMLPEQKAIYYLSGDNEETLRSSPLLEAYRSRKIEVLILDDEIDEFAIGMVPKYREHDLKSVNRGEAAEELGSERDRKAEQAVRPVVVKIKASLGDRVKDVRLSVRLADSPCCIVVDQDDPTIKMQQMLRALGRNGKEEIRPILEINPTHPIITGLAAVTEQQVIDDVSWLLFQQAILLENVALKEPTHFVQRLNRLLGQAVNL